MFRPGPPVGPTVGKVPGILGSGSCLLDPLTCQVFKASVFKAKLIWAKVPGTTTGNGIHITLQIHKAFSQFHLPVALEVDPESDRATHRQELSQTARTEEPRRGMRGAWNMDWPCPGVVRGGSGKR